MVRENRHGGRAGEGGKCDGRARWLGYASMDATARAELARMLSTPPSSADGATAAGVLLVSMKPCYAQLIEVGFKRVEFRKRVPADVRAGMTVVFYVCAPVQAVGLRARVAAVCR